MSINEKYLTDEDRRDLEEIRNRNPELDEETMRNLRSLRALRSLIKKRLEDREFWDKMRETYALAKACYEELRDVESKYIRVSKLTNRLRKLSISER